MATKLRMRQAIAAAMHDAMSADSRVVLLGEDVAAAGGVFKTSEGLLDTFGPDRVRDTPISEMGFLGAAVGAAMTGLRPVVEIMFAEFLGVALDQLLTEAAKMHFLSGGQVSVPLVVRGSAGAGLGFGAQHSQSLETWLTSTPGLKLAVASTPQNAYGLLRAAIRDENPVVVLEPRRLYGDRSEVTTGEAGVVPLGIAERRGTGTDVTIVTAGGMVRPVLTAQESASWSADVLDLQTLVPWDRAAVVASVGRTGRLVVVEESPFTGGWGGEVAAYAARQCYAQLQAPVLRITCPDTPVPFAAELEELFLPSPAYIRAQVDALLATGEAPDPWWLSKEVAL